MISYFKWENKRVSSNTVQHGDRITRQGADRSSSRTTDIAVIRCSTKIAGAEKPVPPTIDKGDGKASISQAVVNEIQ